MNNTLKNGLSIVFIIGLFIHFSIVFLFTAPLLNHTSLKGYSQTYCYPYFYQSWSLFTPIPTCKHQVFVRYFKNNQWSDFEDIFTHEQALHQGNRFSGKENMVLLFSNSLSYLQPFLLTKSAIHQQSTTKETDIVLFELNQYLKLRYALHDETNYQVLFVTTQNASTKAHYFDHLTIN